MSYFTPKISSNQAVFRHVALMIETSNSYARGLIRGVRAFKRENHTWSVYLWEHSRNNTDLSWLENWKGDGIIARIENKQIANFIENTGLPAVDVSASRLLPQLPCIETNDLSIAELSFQHLQDRGFKHFAYCGDSRFNWSKLRHYHFSSIAKKSGYNCAVFDSSRASLDNAEHQSMINWIQSLPKPCGIMACYDIQGQRLLEACQHARVHVPDEVGVIGVDNDELLCELSSPTLTSIMPNSIKTGYEASALLERMMSGEEVSTQIQLIEPYDIKIRESTDILKIEDHIVANSIRFIQKHAHLNINVRDILHIIPVSRRVLESRFHKALGRTPHEEIINVKVQRAKQMLVETTLTIPLIAENTGFKHTEYFSVVFKKKAGMSPSVYRSKYSKSSPIE